MDFLLWGYVNNEVYKITPTTKDDMKERIKTVFRNINNIVLKSVSDSFEKCINNCLNVNGNHIEHLFLNITVVIIIRMQFYCTFCYEISCIL
ncbi:hypothetical protein D910_11092 [Dendroctonus ponderosae]|uniref:Uncharacterized protein n=1 Tax=Dendroctonus ponderosae TaxID=77166 RepID=U4UUD9_DENPD|nr:hypothetical protein D910_11092 [Dendroctonus ponderosae]